MSPDLNFLLSFSVSNVGWDAFDDLSAMDVREFRPLLFDRLLRVRVRGIES